MRQNPKEKPAGSITESEEKGTADSIPQIRQQEEENGRVQQTDCIL